LRTASAPFISGLEVPLPNLGFSLAGFTRSIAPVSRRARLCGTFKALIPWQSFRKERSRQA